MARSRLLRLLSGTLAIAALTELVLLRTGTRTLVNIPGLGRFEVSIGILGEMGRLAYYLAVVLLVTTLIYLGHLLWTGGSGLWRLRGALTWSFVAAALAGRLGLAPVGAVAWFSLAVVVAVAVSTFGGIRSLPVGLFIASSVVASWSVLGQGAGGGLSGTTVDVAVVIAEALLILAGVTTPLMLRGRVAAPALIAGAGAFVLIATGFSVGGSTLSILTLWNLGVPGWFSPVAYGLAFAGLTATLWSALRGREVFTAVAVVLLVAGGVGAISTYQTGLVLAAVLLVGMAGEPAFGGGGWRTEEDVEPDRPFAGERSLPISVS